MKGRGGEPAKGGQEKRQMKNEKKAEKERPPEAGRLIAQI